MPDCNNPSCLAALAAIEQRLISIEDNGKEAATDVKELKEHLFVGNGQPGVLPAMAIDIERLKQELDRQRGVQEKRSTNMIVLWSVVLTTVACVLGEHIFTWIEKPSQSPVVTSAKP